MKTSIINTIIITVTIVAISFIASQQAAKWMDIQKDSAKQKAVEDCIKVASYTTESTSGDSKYTASQPIREWYRFCMNEKGYK